MSAHTSFRIGGPVRMMFFPASAQEAAFLISRCRAGGLRFLVMGNGTDLLAADSLPDMAVVKTAGGMAEITERDGVVAAGSGALLSAIAALAQKRGLAGLEFASGIPGTLGGAVFMNAGAYGGEMKDAVRRVSAVGEDGELRTYSGAECDFSYRHSRFSGGGDFIAGAELALSPGDPAQIRAKMDELAARRREKQPLNLPSAGSAFKRPAKGYAAALIESCGLKGYAVGGARVSEKHAGFIVNTGGATFADVTAVMDHVRETVLARTGVVLEPEIRIVR